MPRSRQIASRQLRRLQRAARPLARDGGGDILLRTRASGEPRSMSAARRKHVVAAR